MLTIKKKISLSFLGEEYKDSYIVVRSVGVSEYETMKGTVRDEVIGRFVDGEINQDGEMVKITKENFLELPGEVFVEAFAQMTGNSPKTEGESMNISTQ